MGKDAYYFSHDANAHTDPKILKLRMALGWEGYGIYWAIIENLRNQETYSICESEFMFLTLSLAIDEAKLKQMLSKCLEVNLLEIVDGKVLSPSLLRRMERADEIRNKRKIAGAKGGKAKANAKATLKQNPSIKGKETKEKESKVNKSKPKISFADIDLPNFIDRELWIGFMEMRDLSKKKPVQSERAINSLLSKLNNNPNQANKMLENSMNAGWPDLYVDRFTTANDPTKTADHGLLINKNAF